MIKYQCTECKKFTSGRRAVGDGTKYYPRKHKNPRTGKTCVGCYVHAVRVEVVVQ